MPPNGKAAAVDRILPEAHYSAEWGSSERGLLNPDPSTGFSSLDGQEQIRTREGACQQARKGVLGMCEAGGGGKQIPPVGRNDKAERESPPRLAKCARRGRDTYIFTLRLTASRWG
jgi:hypothetical protein